ncbi:MAG: TlpA disulfide reductase family protein [Bacteroidia bacterium]
MKIYTLIFSILFLSFNAAAVEPNVWFSGKIKKYAGDSLYLKGQNTYESLITEHQEIMAVKAGKDGSFQFAFHTDWITELHLYSEKGIILFDIYLGPGDSLFLEVRKGLFKTKQSYRGNAAQMNASRTQFVDRFFRTAKAMIYYQSYSEMSLDNFNHFIDERRQDQLQFWDSLNESGIVSAVHSDFMKQDINQRWAIDKLQYLWRHPMSKGSGTSIFPEPGYYAFLDEAGLYADSSVYLGSYYSLLNAFSTNLLSRGANEVKEDEEKHKKIFENQFIYKAKEGEKLLAGPNRDAFYAHQVEMLTQAEWIADSEELDLLLAMYYQKETSPAFSNVIEAIAGNFRAGLAEEITPSFVVKNLKGAPISISDFRGSVVYLDFWATNCAPCIKAIPESNLLQEQLKDEDVVFLIIAFDTDSKLWEKMVKDKAFSGTHGITPNQATREYLYKTFNFRGYPRYAIIGKDGKLKTMNAPGPGKEALNKIKEELTR